MEVVIKFNDEEQEQAVRALKADDAYALLWDLDQKLRADCKYNEELMDSEKVRELLKELMHDYSISLEKEYP